MEHHRVPAPSAQPQTGPHPEEVDPLGKTHKPSLPPEEKRTLSLLSTGLVGAIIIIPIIAVISDSPIVNVFVGLLPLIISLALEMSAVRHHYKLTSLWLIIAVVHVLALAVLYLINFLLATPINVGSAVSLSVLLSIAVTLIAIMATTREAPRPKHVVEFKPEKIQEYVQSIEDKVKAINFVVGRVYRSSNGGTVKMRERLRVPSEWYNEFTAIKDHDVTEQLDKAHVIIRKIRDRLSLYTQKEKDVFAHQEISSLKHLARQKDGDDTIIMVLKTNDRDPVEHYFVSAIEFCDRILEELERMKKQ